MKKIFTCVMLAALMVGLSACGKSEEDAGSSSQQKSGKLEGTQLQKNWNKNF